MKVGYLGPDGTFSQLAAEKYIATLAEGAEAVAFSSIPALAAAADGGMVDTAVLPIENSLEGGVNTTLDCLAFDFNLTICDEILLEVHQNLLGNTEIGRVKKLYSHPQPVGQCAQFLAGKLPGVEIIYTNSTAEAAELATKEADSAALGGLLLADIYGLRILAKSVEDASRNTTRFVAVRKGSPVISAADKTSVVFSVENTPGALFKMLSVFDIFAINMMKIESRPAKTILGEYVFFVDIEGTPEVENIRRALDVVEYKSTFFKVLGSYKSK